MDNIVEGLFDASRILCCA